MTENSSPETKALIKKLALSQITEGIPRLNAMGILERSFGFGVGHVTGSNLPSSGATRQLCGEILYPTCQDEKTKILLLRMRADDIKR
jgi:hypothetical protein